jgi:hypothetical protein
MATVSLKERSKINHELKKLGFGGIDDANLFAQMALIYKTHDMFRGLLMATAQDQRRIAYEAMKPHLCFEAKPLADYEAEFKLKVEVEQWDVIDPGNKYFPQPFKVGEIQSEEYKLARLAEEAIAEDTIQRATKGFLTLNCKRCAKEERFPGETRVSAAIFARQSGWRLHPQILCPDCSLLYESVQ